MYLYFNNEDLSDTYCSSNSNFLVQIENWIYCDAWTIFSTHLHHFELKIFIEFELYDLSGFAILCSWLKPSFIENWICDDGQYSMLYKYTLNSKFLLILYIWFTQWRLSRYYCSSNSNHLVQIENWTRCDVWTIFSPHCTNTLWISNFYCNCICIFNSMKIYQILLQFQLKPFSSNWKLNTMWCMDNIQSILSHFEFEIQFINLN